MFENLHIANAVGGNMLKRLGACNSRNTSNKLEQQHQQKAASAVFGLIGEPI
jgi:hypothetical protein